MMKSNPKTSSVVAELERRKIEKRLVRLRTNEDFLSQLRSMRQRIVSGQDLDSIRDDMNLWQKKDRWTDLLFCLQHFTATPEVIFMEWSIKARDRYQLANKAFIEATKVESKGDKVDLMLKSILAMQRVDEQALELYDRLGLVTPRAINAGLDQIDGNTTDGSGISEAQIAEAEDKIRKELANDVRDQLRLEEQAVAPIDIALLEAPKPGGSENPVGEVSVDANDPSGPK